MILFADNLDGMAGVCGVWGEIGFPGDEEVDIEVPATIGGTLESWRLLELDERWRSSDEDMDSDKAVLESLICWNLDKAAFVRLVEASVELPSREALKLFKSFFRSSSFRKSEILSSSVGIDPELPPPSASTPDPGWAAEDVRLVFPLLLSSSVLLPPVDSFAFLCPKLLVYFGA